LTFWQTLKERKRSDIHLCIYRYTMKREIGSSFIFCRWPDRWHRCEQALIYIYICIVQYECRLILLSGRKATSILACIVVETSFIKLNIIRSASDNQKKYIAYIQDIRSISSSLGFFSSSVVVHTDIWIYFSYTHD